MRRRVILAGIAVSVLSLGTAFAGGMLYQDTLAGVFAEAPTPPQIKHFKGMEFKEGDVLKGFPFHHVQGSVVSVEGNTVTVQLESGETRTVTVSEDTKISKTLSLSVQDLQAGEHITVMGQESGEQVEANMIHVGEPPMVKSVRIEKHLGPDDTVTWETREVEQIEE